MSLKVGEVSGGNREATKDMLQGNMPYHLVTRDTISGGVLGPGQKITRQEALRLATFNNAYTTFEEKIKGSIEPGKLADLVVLSDDIMTVPAKSIQSMNVLMTVVGGKIVHQREDFRPSITTGR